MDIVSNVIGLIDVCIRYGDVLIKTCKSYKHADEEIRGSILLIESRWLKIQRQLGLLRNIWPSLDEDYQLHQNSVLQVLQGKAQVAISLIDSVIGKSDGESSMKSIMSKKGNSRRAKYAVFVKSSLQSVLVDLKEWSEVFDVSWYLIIRLSNKDIDKELRPVHNGEKEPLSTLKDLREAINSNLNAPSEAEKATVFLRVDFFDDNGVVLQHSASEIWNDMDKKARYLIDQPSSISTLSDVCKLAKILQKVEPLEFGILACTGIVKCTNNLPSNATPPSRFVFSIPSNLTEPQYLRTSIVSPTNCYTLDDRFSLSKQLAKSVMFVHSAGFVHKNIRPETILIFRDEESTDLWAFLTGFESFRLAVGKTLHQGDDMWEKNLYRHPTRQGVQPESDYSMQHDIYSLGVCLLEIGIGSSLIVSTAGDEKPRPIPAISVVADLSITDRRKKAFETKRALVRMAQEELPSKMGRKYAETVVTCLTCLDKSDNSFGYESEFFDENGVLVGVRFIEKILTALLDLKI